MTANAKRLAYFEQWIDPVAVGMLEARPDIELVRLEFSANASDTWAELSRAHGYQVLPRGDLREPWFGNGALLAKCPRLLAISSTGAGFDMVDVDACTKAGVIVVCQTGTNKEAVAEHALGLMIALSKKIGLTDKALRTGTYVDRYAFTGNDLLGKTVGIVGLGHIGARVAELCKGLLRMRVLAVDPYLSEAEVAARGAEKVEPDRLLAQSDFVTVHCPRNDETFGMFGAAQFAAMKPNAFFLNTARGGIIDAPWPSLDERALEQVEIEMVVQVNGKLRGHIRVPKNAAKEQIEQLALHDEGVQRHTEGKPVKKMIVVPGKLVNVVV